MNRLVTIKKNYALSTFHTERNIMYSTKNSIVYFSLSLSILFQSLNLQAAECIDIEAVLPLNAQREIALNLIPEELSYLQKNRVVPLKLFYKTSPGFNLALSHDKKLVARKTSKNSSTICLIEIETGKVSQTLKGHKGSIKAVAFSPNGKNVITGSIDGTAKLWNVGSDKEPVTFMKHAFPVTSVMFSPCGKKVITSTADDTVKLWDIETNKELLTFFGTMFEHYPLINFSFSPIVDFSPNYKEMIIASVDRTTKLWDTKTGKELITLNRHTSNIEAVAFSPSGKKVVTGFCNGSAKLWGTKNGKKYITFGAHSAPVSVVAFSPTGKEVIIGYWNGDAKLWDTETGKELLVFHRDTNKNDGPGSKEEGVIVVAFDLTYESVYTITHTEIALWDISSKLLDRLKKSITISQAFLILHAYKALKSGAFLAINHNTEDYRALMTIADADVRMFLVRGLSLELRLLKAGL
ncbi:WD40 repeat domain-containing protein [Candidatus Dependentiae bacterium]|nr:WD40 repeat domain-containing protein [Candidatus Dependentiae bacterium]